MIESILIVVAIVALWYAHTATTWERYLAVMAMKRARDAGRLTTAAKVFGYPKAAQALISDALYNAVWGSIMFLEPPREWLLTDRLQRHIRSEENNPKYGWRARWAKWWCHRLLDPFDPDGKHCD